MTVDRVELKSGTLQLVDGEIIGLDKQGSFYRYDWPAATPKRPEDLYGPGMHLYRSRAQNQVVYDSTEKGYSGYWHSLNDVDLLKKYREEHLNPNVQV